MDLSTTHVSTAVVLAVVLSFLIPGISSLISRVHLPTFIAGALTLLISTINGFVTEWSLSPDLNHYHWKSAALIALGSYVVAIGARLQLWQGTTVDAFLLGIGSKKKLNAAPVGAVTGNQVATTLPETEHPAIPVGVVDLANPTTEFVSAPLSFTGPSTGAATDIPTPTVGGNLTGGVETFTASALPSQTADDRPEIDHDALNAAIAADVQADADAAAKNAQIAKDAAG